MAAEKFTVADEVQDIAKDVVNRIFMPEAYYTHERIPQLCSQIAEVTVQKLTHQSKILRKYVAQCTIVQKNGACIHSVSACSWEPNSDGCCTYKAENKAMICILTVFGVTL